MASNLITDKKCVNTQKMSHASDQLYDLITIFADKKCVNTQKLYLYGIQKRTLH